MLHLNCCGLLSITGRWKQRLPPSASLTELSQHFAVLAATNSLPATIPHGPTSADGFIQFHPVCASDVEHILLHLDGSKAGGPDGIRPCELRLAAAAVASSLTALINTSLTSGSLPNEFKTANVTPLLKPGKTDTRLPANYRGISLLCIVSKVLEFFVHQQLAAYLDERGVFSEMQFGFRKGRSCTDLLLSTTDDWLLAMDAKKTTAAVFIDLSKAFDNVVHQELLLTLQRYGVGGVALAWMYDYLKDRQQRIVVYPDTSGPIHCMKGVPQGSVLGPLLFNTYVADLPTIAEENGSLLPSFADDMTLYCSNSSAVEACNTVSATLDQLADALSARGLSMNMEKTVSMLFLPRSLRQQQLGTSPDVLCCRSPVHRVTSTRLLGVFVDDSLSWSAHVEHVCKKWA